MSDDLFIRDGLTLPGWELWYTASRSSGAGGQHVNTTDSRATVHWVPANSSVLNDAQKARIRRKLGSRLTNEGELQVSAQDERSQHRNRDIARQRLAAMIVDALRPRRRRKKTKPTRGSIERRIAQKKQTGQKKRLRQTPEFDD